MPGYDRNRFTELGRDEYEFTCGICQDIFKKPVVVPCCRQTYCEECINQWLTEHQTCPNDRSNLERNNLTQPPVVFINLLSKLKIKCEFACVGCDQVCQLDQLSHHLSIECHYNPDRKCQNCQKLETDLKLTKQDLTELKNRFDSAEKVRLKITNLYTSLVQELNESANSFERKRMRSMVIFSDVSPVYPFGDIECRFHVTSDLIVPEDKIGLYRVGWKQLSEFIIMKDMQNSLTDEFGEKKITYTLNELNGKVSRNDKYQFCYFHWSVENAIYEFCDASSEFGIHVPLCDGNQRQPNRNPNAHDICHPQ